ncbi:hypothetical protein HYU07_04325 [Candidatus Woesearchaeota archaeon]|nr:hypothetical protein [Candidatus Woesearchaeota archaeon]
MEQLLKEIKDAEQKAKGIAERANREKEKIIQEAIQQSDLLFSRRKAELESKNKAEIEKKRKELGEERAAIVEKAKKDAEILEKNARKNIQKAANYILEKFEERIKNV